MTIALYCALGVTISLELIFAIALILLIDKTIEFKRAATIYIINLIFMLILFAMKHVI